MKFKVTRSSDWLEDEPKTVELATLEDLMAYIKQCNHSVIVHYFDDTPTLEIYDYYRE
jgi:hypothetical protein